MTTTGLAVDTLIATISRLI